MRTVYFANIFHECINDFIDLGMLSIKCMTEIQLAFLFCRFIKFSGNFLVLPLTMESFPIGCDPTTQLQWCWRREYVQ